MMTGDEAIDYLISEGGSEAATYSDNDKSRAALIARNGHLFARLIDPNHASMIGYYEMFLSDGEALEREGLVRLYGIGGGGSCNWYLTDAGASLARNLAA